jgi:hypothetical protein
MHRNKAAIDVSSKACIAISSHRNRHWNRYGTPTETGTGTNAGTHLAGAVPSEPRGTLPSAWFGGVRSTWCNPPHPARHSAVDVTTRHDSRASDEKNVRYLKRKQKALNRRLCTIARAAASLCACSHVTLHEQPGHFARAATSLCTSSRDTLRV